MTTPTPPPFDESTAILCAEAFEKRLSGIYVAGYKEMPKIIRDACTLIASLRQDLADCRAERDHIVAQCDALNEMREKKAVRVKSRKEVKP